jgi:hypothetical protein
MLLYSASLSATALGSSLSSHAPHFMREGSNM